MKSMKCAQCGLVNWVSAEACKRCGAQFQSANESAFQSADAPVFAQPAYATAAPYQAAPYAYQQPYTYQQPYGYQQYYPALKQSSGLAAASLIVGIISIFTLSLLGLAAMTGIILGIVALVKIKSDPARYGGQGMAIAGLVTSSLSVVLAFFIVMAIAIPNLLASRRAANEGSALSQLRTIGMQEATYQATNGDGEYGTLQELRNANLLDTKLDGGTYHGYRFSVRVRHSTRDAYAAFEVVATPTSYRDSGTRSFYLDESGVIRAADRGGAEADAKDRPLGN
jgi:type IV pilus assembly protein PilA